MAFYDLERSMLQFGYLFAWAGQRDENAVHSRRIHCHLIRLILVVSLHNQTTYSVGELNPISFASILVPFTVDSTVSEHGHSVSKLFHLVVSEF